MKTMSLVIFASLSLLLPSCSGGPSVPDNQVVLLPVASDPTISFRIWFKVGAQDDPAGKEGLAALTASMMTSGATTTNSYEQILDKLFPLAASYNSSTSVEMTVMYGRVHKDNLADFYPLFLDAMLRPAFREEDLERLKSEALNYLENTLRYANDEELGKAVLYNTIFAGTGYGHITPGLVESVKSITVDDVKSFHARYFTRDRVVIGVGGGYTDEIVERLRHDLASLPAGTAPIAPKPQLEQLSGMQVTIVEKDAASTAMSMGFPIDILRGPREWYALAIANSWLGEHRNQSSHLYNVIREKRGLNYGDYSYIEHFPNGGRLQMPPQNASRRQQIFEIWIRPVPNDTRHFTLRAALREFKKLVDNGLTPEEFELTRNFLRKYVLHYAPTTMERLGYALDDVFYGIDGSHLERFRALMSEITLEEVNAAIRKHLQYGRMQIVMVTKDAAALKTALEDDSPSPITYATPKPQEVLEEDAKISVFPLKIPAEKITVVPVAELFVR